MIQMELHSNQSLFHGCYLEIYTASNILSKFLKYKWYRTEWLNMIAEFF